MMAFFIFQLGSGSGDDDHLGLLVAKTDDDFPATFGATIISGDECRHLIGPAGFGRRPPGGWLVQPGLHFAGSTVHYVGG